MTGVCSLFFNFETDKIKSAYMIMPAIAPEESINISLADGPRFSVKFWCISSLTAYKTDVTSAQPYGRIPFLLKEIRYAHES